MIEEKLLTVTWVKLSRWTELTGDSSNAVHSRLQVGKWAYGKHAKIVDKRLWICVPEAMRWVDRYQAEQRAAK